MRVDNLNAAALIPEYQTLVHECMWPGGHEINWTMLRKSLSNTAEWSESAAAHLVDLARNYGAFMLRNALAIAVAAGIEDGELGF
jgi:hypothetical protein